MEDLNREVMEKKDESVEMKEVDRISNFPDPLVDIILSFLTAEDVMRMSFASKRWQSLYLTNPNLDCDESLFYDINKSFSQTRIQFLNFMNNTLFNRSNNPINNLRVSAIYPFTYDLDSLLNDYLHFLSTDHCKLLTLEISIPTIFSTPIADRKYYLVPNAILIAGFYLTNLTLEGCTFEDRYYDIVKSNFFPYLKNVFFKCVSISDKLLEMMILNCPIETIVLKLCRGFELLRVCNYHLTSLIVSNCSQIQWVHIYAPKLYFFDIDMAAIPSITNVFKIYLDNEINDFWLPFKMRFLSVLAFSHVILRQMALKSMFSSSFYVKEVSFNHCEFKRVPLNLPKTVEKLEIKDCYFNGSVANALTNIEHMEMLSDFSYILFEHDVLGKALSHLKSVLLCGEIFFPGNRFIMKNYKGFVFLEKLCLENCKNLKEIEISVSALKTLVVDSCLDLEECKIQAPNLEFFKYVGYVMDFVIADELVLGPHVVGDLHLLKPCEIDFNCYLYDLDVWSFLQHFDRVRDLSFTNYCVDEPMHKDTSIELKLFHKFDVDHSSKESNLWKTIKEHLVEVKVIVYEGKEDEILMLLEYLLLEATFLRTMSISSIGKIPAPAKFHSDIKTIMIDTLASPYVEVIIN